MGCRVFLLSHHLTTPAGIRSFPCVDPKGSIGLVVDTIFEKSHTPLPKWFWALILVAHDQRGLSALALAREIQVTYKTAWLMLHKIRPAMGAREEADRLAGIVEMDEAYVGGPGEEPKRGRGTNKTPTLVALSLHPDGKTGYLRMQAYLNEYTYCYNRRHFQGEWFNRLLHASISSNARFAPLSIDIVSCHDHHTAY